MNVAEAIAKRWRSLSVRTVIALVVGVAAAVAFLEITDAVLEGEATHFDRTVALWLHGLDSPALDRVMRVLTLLGSFYFLGPLVMAVGIWAWLCTRRDLAAVLGAVAATTEALNLALKHVFHRPRPTLFTEIVRPESFSFPSGHAMASVAIYGMAAFVIGRLQPRARWPVYVGSAVLVLLIGISRVFLGVHWPTDVLAGFAAGSIVLAATRLVRPPLGKGGS